ncbi:MAG: TOBE-like domain-containing protein [Burkholderiaceae bacterium]
MKPLRSPPSPRYTDALGHGMSDKRIDILRGIGRSGSISQAARDVGVSYKAAWQAIDTLTNLAGVPLVERAVGGSGGGGALLTAQGTELLELAGALDSAKAMVQERWRAAGGAAGQGTVPFALRTSMRNQLPATVTSIETIGPLARVSLRIGEAATVSARITRESVELLGLAPGQPVIVLCKATAVIVARAESSPKSKRLAAVNRLEGKAATVERGDQGDEVSLALAGSGQLVGFAAPGSAIHVRHRVIAQIDEAALVIALA